MDNQELALFQLCDSNFPTGAFSHSYGLETYIQEERVHDSLTLSQWLRSYVLGQLVYADGLAVRFTHGALDRGDMEKVWELDRLLYVQNLPRETREGTQKMGDRMLTLVSSLYDAPHFAQYRERIRQKQSYGHPAIVFTMAGHHLGIPWATTLLYYLYSVTTSLVQNAVRAIPLGQTAGQQVIQQFQTVLTEATAKVEQLDAEDFGIVAPGLELAQMIHEHVHVRIFMS